MSFLSELGKVAAQGAKMAIKGAKSVKGMWDERTVEIYEEMKHYSPEQLERIANDERKDATKRIVATRMLRGWKPEGASEEKFED